MRFALTLVGLAVAMVAQSLPARAHHSPSLFDQERVLTLEGVVTRVEWTNPHVSLHVEVQGERRAAVLWVVEAQSPRVMGLFGWTPASLERGDGVTIAANPPRNEATTTALGRSVLKRDGTLLRIPWQPQEIRDALRADSSRRR